MLLKLPGLILYLKISHFSTNFCPCTLRMIYVFTFVCLTHIYVNVLYWIIRFYYYGFLVNEGICFICNTDIQSIFSEYYASKDVYTTSFIVWFTTFPFIILKAHYTIGNIVIIRQCFKIIFFFKAYYHCCTRCILNFTDIMVYYIFMYINMCLFTILTINLLVISIYHLLSIMPLPLYANHTS